MKARLTLLALAMMCGVACGAKTLKTLVVKTNPEIHCENCEKKIKDNIRFEKGVKEIVTNLDDKTVSIKFDADKVSVETLLVAFEKISYKATVVEVKDVEKKKSPDAVSGATTLY